jgi:hypothetical protein
MVYGIWLALLGVLAVPNLVLAKKPDAKELLAKITPYQGWIGAFSCVGGLYSLVFNSLLNLGLMSVSFRWWLTITAGSLLQVALGLILGIGTMKMFIKNPEAQARMDETLAKIAPHQGRLGLAAIGLGAWWVISSILWHV